MPSRALKFAANRTTVSIAEYGAKADGGATDSSPFIQAAINSLPGSGGTVFVGPGVFRCDTLIDLGGRTSVTLLGTGGVSSGANAGSTLVYTGTDTRAVDMHNATGCALRNLQVQYNNAGFVGVVIMLDSVYAFASVNCLLENVQLGGNSVHGASAMVGLQNSVAATLRKVHMAGAQRGVRGLKTIADYSTTNKIHDCTFGEMYVANIQDIGEAWSIVDSSIEPLHSGAPGSIHFTLAGGTRPIQVGHGVRIHGCWFGDASLAGTWIEIAGRGWDVAGNYFGGTFAAAITAISIADNVADGVNVSGNTFDTCTVGVAMLPDNDRIHIGPNGWINTATDVTGTPVSGTITRKDGSIEHYANGGVFNQSSVSIRFDAPATYIVEPSSGSNAIQLVPHAAAPSFIQTLHDLNLSAAAGCSVRMQSSGVTFLDASTNEVKASRTISSAPQTVSATGAVLFTMATGNVTVLTLVGPVTLTFSGLKYAEYCLRFIQDGTGGRVITWPGNMLWPGGVKGILSVAAGAIDEVVGHSDGTSFFVDSFNKAYS